MTTLSAVSGQVELKGQDSYTYKILTTRQPTYLSTLLNHYTPLRTLRSDNQYCLQHLRFPLSLPRGHSVTSRTTNLEQHTARYQALFYPTNVI